MQAALAIANSDRLPLTEGTGCRRAAVLIAEAVTTSRSKTTIDDVFPSHFREVLPEEGADADLAIGPI